MFLIWKTWRSENREKRVGSRTTIARKLVTNPTLAMKKKHASWKLTILPKDHEDRIAGKGTLVNMRRG